MCSSGALAVVLTVGSLLSGTASALPSSGSLAATWTAAVSPPVVASSELAHSGVAVVGATVHVATGAEISRFSVDTGAAQSSWDAPAGVVFTAVAAGPSGSVLAAGAKGTDGWIGRYSAAGSLQWSESLTGGSKVQPVGIAVVGTVAYLAGNAPGSFGREVFVRRYDDIGGTPSMAWEKVGATASGDFVTDVTATASAVYVGGAALGPFSVPAVWRFAASNGATTTEELDLGIGGFRSASVTGIAAEGERLYVSWQGGSTTVAFLEQDGGVARLDPTTLAVRWDTSIGTSYTPGSPPVQGDTDLAHDVAIDGSSVVVVGELVGGSQSGITGFVGSGGFIARYTDDGTSASRQFIRRAETLASATVHSGDLYVTTGPASETNTGGACAVDPGEDCTLARIVESSSAPPPPDPGFSDVPASAFYADAVAWLKAEGITTGTSATTFSPNDTVTRGQMAAFLFRLAGEPGGSPAHGFSDVPASAFYADAVAWLKAEGITTGTSATTFSPNDTVTRGQMAAFLFRLAGEPGGSPAHGFSDVPASAFYAEAVKWLKAEGITTGTSPTTFSPGDAVTRGQMAAFLYRYATGG